MKKLLIILLFIPLLSQAQYFDALSQPKHSHPWKTVALYSGSVLLNAVGDGLNDEGHKGWGHTANAFSISLVVLSPLVLDYDKSKWYAYLLDYGFLRIALFDYAYNVARGLKITFVGSTSYWDILLSKFNPVFIMFVKFICLLIGIYLFLI